MTRLRKMNLIDHYSYLPPYSFTSCPTYPEIQTPIDLPIFPSPMSISAHPLARTLVRDALLLHDAHTPAVSTLICVARLSARAPAHSPRPQKSPARSPMTNCLSPPFACPPAHPPCPPKSELSTRPHDGCVVFCLCFFVFLVLFADTRPLTLAVPTPSVWHAFRPALTPAHLPRPQICPHARAPMRICLGPPRHCGMPRRVYLQVPHSTPTPISLHACVRLPACVP